MTPKEKAIELIGNFYNIKISTNKFRREEAKQCAIIAVDEILELDVCWYSQSMVNDYPKSYRKSQTFEFWEEVKQEIELL